MDDRDRYDRDYFGEAKSAATSDLGKTVLKGAAIGAVAAAVLPFVGWVFGAVAGGGYAAYRKLKK